MIIIGLIAVILILKLQQRPRRVVFEVKSRVQLRCGCIMVREEVSGSVDVQACAAHRAMADSL